MKTRLTELLSIERPILCSGMSWIATPEVVAAVCNAGGMGILATGVLSAEETTAAIDRTRELTHRPFMANVTLYFPGAERNAQICIDKQVPVVNWSLGKGEWICEAVHAYGGKVLATVTNIKHALSAQKQGADAIIATGHEAGGHGGDITSLVLIPALADALDIPVVAAGGFADGRGLLAALALGADGISMGTRFMNTVESPVHDNMKRVARDKGIHDTLYTDRIDGLPLRVLKSAGVRRLLDRPMNPFKALIYSRRIAEMTGHPWARLAIGVTLSGPEKALQMARMAIGFEAFRAATLDGDKDRGALPIGQDVGLMHDTPTIAELMDRMEQEVEAAYATLGPLVAP